MDYDGGGLQVLEGNAAAAGGSGSGAGSTAYDMQQLQANAQFLAAQMAALHEAGSLAAAAAAAAAPAALAAADTSVAGASMPFLGWLKRQAAEQAAAAAEARAAKRKRASEAAAAVASPAEAGSTPPVHLPAVCRRRPAAGNSLANGSAPQQAATPSGAAAAAPPAGASTAAKPSAAGGSSSKPMKFKLNLHGSSGGGGVATPAEASAAALDPAVAVAVAPAAPVSKASPTAAAFKPKIKLKGQILPQAQPPPQDTGSQIQGHPPGADSAGGPAQQQQQQHSGAGHSQQAHKPKLKLVMPKGFASWGAPPPHPSSGQLQTQRSWDYTDHSYQQQQQQHQQHQQHQYYYQQQQQHYQQPRISAREQQRAAAAAARQAAAEARAAAAAARAQEEERLRREHELQLQLKRQAEAAADIARGMPPLPTRSFRLPASLVGELLQLWEFCQAFGAALGVPPFSLEQLEAALMPGPLTEDEKKASAEVTMAAADAEAATVAHAAAADLAKAITEAQAAEAAAAKAAEPVSDAAAAAAAPVAAAAAAGPALGNAGAAAAGPAEVAAGGAAAAPAAVAAEPEVPAADAVQAPPPPAAAASPLQQQEPEQLPQIKQEAATDQQAAVQQQQLQPEPKLEVPHQQQQQHVKLEQEEQRAAEIKQEAAGQAVQVKQEPASRKPFKIKVRLGGLARQDSSSSQQQAAASTATAAAAAETAVEPAAVGAAAAAAAADPGAVTGMDPAALAAGAMDPAAAAAAGWMHAGPTAAQPPQGLTLEAVAAAAAAAEEEEAKKQPDVGIADRQSLASSLLLRDVHTALLRLLDGTAARPGKKLMRQPLTAKMCPPEGLKQQAVLMGQPHWACRVGYALSAACAVDKAATHVEAVLPQLVSGDYASLPLHARMAVLRSLMELALASETLRAHLDARIEAYTGPRPIRADTFRAFAGALTGPQQPGPGRGRWARPSAGAAAAAAGGGGGEGGGGPSEDERRAAAAASDRGTAGRMLEDWMEWLAQQEQHSVGLRVPVGSDCRERRYWLLGGVAGAWRLYCEEKEGQLWGYYEGEQLLRLAHWIACAAIEAELPLLHTLCTMPWPYRPGLTLLGVSAAATAAAAAAGAAPPSTPGSVAYWASVATGNSGLGFGGYHYSPAEAGVVPLGPQLLAGLCVPHPLQLMSGGEMRRHRPDGYRGLAAPLLYGEADVVGGASLASSEARFSWGLASLLGAAPFYAPGAQQQLLQKLGLAMEQAQAASTCGAYTAALLALEALLTAAQLQPAPLSSQWRAQWQQRWRHSLAACGPSSWEALLLHLALLGRHVLHVEHAIGREGFLRLASSCKCPLRFPSIGEEWMLARTPLLQHIDKYRRLPAAATSPLPPAAAELNAAADVVRKLPPVSCYKVVGVAFCAYPMPEALRKQAQPPVDESAAAAATAAGALGEHDSLLTDADEADAAALLAAAAALGDAKQYSIAAVFDDDDIGGLLDFDVDELINDDVAALDHAHSGVSRLPSLQLPPLPPELQEQPGSHGAAAAAAGGASAPAGAGDTAASLAAQLQQQLSSSVPPVPGSTENGKVAFRPPCMWALMSPVSRSSGIGNGNSSVMAAAGNDGRGGASLPSHYQQPMQHDAAAEGGGQQQRPCIAVPFHIDCFLQEFLVSPAAYEAGARHSWLPGDRFATYSGPQQQHQGPKAAPPAPGGSVMSVDEALEGEAPDPWESITVLWDSNDNSADLEHKVSPWEIQPEQDHAAHAAETARTAAQEASGSESTQQQGGGGVAGDAADSSAAAQRAARRRAGRAIDISSLIGAMMTTTNCGGRRRGKGRGRGGGGGVTWGGERGPKGSKRGRGSDDEDFKASEGQPPSGKRGGRVGGGARGGAGSGAQQWGMDPIRQQQGSHLAMKQQQMLAAMLAGNQAALAQLCNVPPSAPIHDQPLPTPLKPDCLAALPCRASFITLVADYNIHLKGQFNAPMWNSRELDLYSLFMVVNVRGGYEAVCRTNRWPDVCRAMSCSKDPTAADAMRTNYEKCLVEFEQYVRRGGWEQDRQTARRPQALKEDTAAAFEQVMRAGKAAAAAPPPPPPAPAPPPAGMGQRPQLVALPANLAQAMPGLGQPGGPAIVGLNPAGQIIVSATAQQMQAMQMQLRMQSQQQQQQALLLAQQGKAAVSAPASGAPAVVPAGPAGPGAAAAAAAAQTQQALLRQQLLQQAQLQAAAAAAAATGGAGVPVVSGAAAAASGAPAGNPQLQALLQQQQLQKAAAAPKAAVTSSSAQALAGTGSINFSSLLDDL
ncbi:hypothetical protein COO60DRAFT_1700751 [Scenedesmus sp. NREL 46B-D3]|nr:hypothetical protein COO60DRAFT_1700751 [Scenedesmus sp. NREL 46B-D3]